MGRSLHAGLAARWRERRHFRRWRDWPLSLYDRALSRWPRLPLPWRGRAARIWFKAMHDPVRVRLGSTDLRTASEIYFGGQYDRVVDGSLGMYRTIVDLGANAGYSVALWHARFPDCRVLAVEPDADNMRVCCSNAGNAAGDVFVQACVAGRARQVTLDRSGGEWGYEMREAAGDAGGDAQTIPALTLEQILSQAGSGWDGPIDLLKCNIEGAEAEIFAGAPPWIARVRCAVVDVHKPYTAEQMLADFRAADGRDWRIERLDGNDHREMILATPGEPT